MPFIDIQNDPGYAGLSVIVSTFPKIASVTEPGMSLVDLQQLPDTCFACPALRKYPIHTPGHAAVSIGYAKYAEALPPGTKEELAKAEELYALTPIFAEQIKTASAENPADYLLPEQLRFKVSNAEDVKAFELIFREKLAVCGIEDRIQMGVRFEDSAAKFHVKLAASTQKLIFNTLTSTQQLRDQLSARVEAAYRNGSEKFASVFEAFKADLEGAPAFLHSRSEQLKLASAINTLDKQAGVQKYYNKGIADPLTAVFNTEYPSKQYIKVSSALTNRALLEKLPLSFWSDALGPETVSEIAPGGVLDVALLEQVISTLPADLKATLEIQLAAYK